MDVAISKKILSVMSNKEISWEMLLFLTEQKTMILGSILVEEFQTGKHIHKGHLYYDIGFWHFVNFRFGEAKAYFEQAIEEDKAKYGLSDYENAPAFKLYSFLFPSGEAIIEKRTGQVVEELTNKEIPRMKREIGELRKKEHKPDKEKTD